VIILYAGPNQAEFGRLREIIFMHQADGAAQLTGAGRQGRRCWLGGNLLKITLHPGFGLDQINIPGNDDGSIIGTVPFFVKFLYIINGGGLQILEAADDLPVIGMIGGVKRFIHHIGSVAIGHIIYALTLFILNHFLFIFEYGSRYRINQKTHAVTFHP